MTAELYRPRLHFSPQAGWLNDPNGLIFVDGRWHMFYQHHPHSTLWGPMHWGHASSSDLVGWTEHPIALRPNQLGTCFSGSAIETAAGGVKLFYTAHRSAPDGSDLQEQCLVHADRTLTQFVTEATNPIVANPGLTAFRDPKVFWHEPTHRWVMVVTHGQSIGIRSSIDLLKWDLESEFGEAEGRHGTGPWECPDLLQLITPEGQFRWVLIIGIGSDAYGGGSGTQYFIGDFDGHSFINANPPDTVLWMDYGRDYYAAQSFSGAAQATTMAWASNWQYARELPTTAFRGVMALPRELSLANTPQGLRLRQTIPASVANSFPPADLGKRPESGTYRFHLDLRGKKDVALTLFGASEPQVVITGPVMSRTLTTRRSSTGITGFAHEYQVPLPETAASIDVFVDNGLVELGSSDGLVWISNLYFPLDVAGAVRIEPTALAA